MTEQQAQQAIDDGDFLAAIAIIDALLQLEPAQPKLWQQKALSLLSLGQPEAAIIAAEQAIRLTPGIAISHQLLGKAHKMLGNVSAAIAAYKQAAYCYLDQKDKINAQKCFRQLEQLKSSKTRTRPLLSASEFLAAAIDKIKADQTHEALQDLNWLLNVEPDNIEALGQRGLLHARLGHYQDAVEDFSKATTLAPDLPAIKLQRAEMRLLLGDVQGTKTDCTDLLNHSALDPGKIYTLRGQAYQQLNEWDNAFKDFSNALGINPQNADCYEARGKVYEFLDNTDEAIKDYRQAATLYLEQGNAAKHQAMIQMLKTVHSGFEMIEQLIRVPIKYFSNGIPVIDVLFNHQFRFEMIVDTGTAMTCINLHMAERVGLRADKFEEFRLGDGQLIEEPVGIIDSIAIGLAEANYLEVAISPELSIGLLGQNFLSRFDIHILQTEIELGFR